jgi:hypothetical protein
MKVQFVLNVPETLALQDPSGLYNQEYEEVSYPTVDGRILTLPVLAAERLMPCSKCRGIGASHNNSAAVPCDACGGTGKVAISKP